jgi:hypothetical protein
MVVSLNRYEVEKPQSEAVCRLNARSMPVKDPSQVRRQDAREGALTGQTIGFPVIPLPCRAKAARFCAIETAALFNPGTPLLQNGAPNEWQLARALAVTLIASPRRAHY